MAVILNLDPRAVPLTRLDNGVYRVTNTRIPLERIVEHYQAGETPEQIVDAYDTLRLSDVYSVIAYYLDHKEEVEQYLREQDEQAEEISRMIEASQPPRPWMRAELLARKARMDEREGRTGERPAVTLDQQLSLRKAYLTMWVFAVRYWKRGKKADVMTDFITDISPVLDDETCDPAQIHDWLAAAEYVLAHPEQPWGSCGDGEKDVDAGSFPTASADGGGTP
jgi:uncharacterized protein (DUF433 family)